MTTKRMALSAAFLAAAILMQSSSAYAEKDVYLHQIPRISGFIHSLGDSNQFHVATQVGIFQVETSGLLKNQIDSPGALIEAVQIPDKPQTLLGSGYKSKDEKLGVLRSFDGGKSWTKISNGAKDPVAFSAIAVSRSAPEIIYAVESQALQMSRDGGVSWRVVGDLPGPAFDLAVSIDVPSTVYAATNGGLFVSRNGGETWDKGHPDEKPATFIYVAANGDRYTFIYQVGLLKAEATSEKWSMVSNGFSGRALMEFMINPSKPDMWLASADTGAVFISQNSGQTWKSFEGHLDATPTRIAKGKELYNNNCQTCHGVKGVGEKPDDLYANDENGLPVAPPLDDSAHGWHHSDSQLIETIMNGSPRNERMLAWKDHGLTKEDARDVVAYIKSLWNFSSLACQGPRHMRCMQ